jgi:CheY-like chemotaxis protein
MSAATPGRQLDRIQTVLVHEHDVALRMALVQLLRDCGYRVIAAANTYEAVTILEESKRRLDVLLSEVNIPGPINGFALAQWARSTYPELKILLAGTATRMLQNTTELCQVRALGRRYEHALMLERIKRLVKRKSGERSA